MDFTTGLIETMYVYNGKIALEACHKNRLEKGLELYNFKLSSDKIFEEIYRHIERNQYDALELKARLEIFPTPTASSMQLHVEPFSRKDVHPIKLGFASGLHIDSQNSNNLKTTNRSLYHEAHQQAEKMQCDDVILCNEKGQLVETSIYSLLWKDEASDKWFTPPLHSGCVAGVQRQYLLDSGSVSERDCYPHDLLVSKSIMVCNALRGVVAVAELQY